MPIGIDAAMHQSLRFETKQGALHGVNIDSPRCRQPPFGDAFDGIGCIRMIMQIAQDGIDDECEVFILRLHACAPRRDERGWRSHRLAVVDHADATGMPSHVIPAFPE
jgi:hypothetical protein